MILKKNFLKNLLPRRDMSCSQNGNVGKGGSLRKKTNLNICYVYQHFYIYIEELSQKK